MSYGTMKSVDDNGIPRPPSTPRRARFGMSELWKWAGALFVGWFGLMWLCRVWLDPQHLYHRSSFPSGYTIMWMMMGLVTTIALPLGLVLAVCTQMIRKQRKLFTEGISTLATVTHVGIIRNPMSNLFCVGVRWSFRYGRVEVTGETPYEELPKAAVGDKLWVLYEKGNPWYARRWALFDKDGNMLSDDRMTWKREVDMNFMY